MLGQALAESIWDSQILRLKPMLESQILWLKKMHHLVEEDESSG